jgi:hypothetical protein
MPNDVLLMTTERVLIFVIALLQRFKQSSMREDSNSCHKKFLIPQT